MMELKTLLRTARLAAVLAAALGVAACANNPAENAQANAAGMAGLVPAIWSKRITGTHPVMTAER